MNQIQSTTATDRESEIIALIASSLSREQLFRFSYVPITIGEMVWSYADTVTDIAALLRISETKSLCRAIKELRRSYERWRYRHFDSAHRKGEEANAENFEDAVSDILSQLCLNINLDIKRTWPELDGEYVMLLNAVAQCNILLSALMRYAASQARKVSAIIGFKIGDVLPDELHKLHKLIPLFVGDKRFSSGFAKLREQYIATFAAQIGLIQLDEQYSPYEDGSQS